MSKFLVYALSLLLIVFPITSIMIMIFLKDNTWGQIIFFLLQASYILVGLYYLTEEFGLHKKNRNHNRVP